MKREALQTVERFLSSAASPRSYSFLRILLSAQSINWKVACSPIIYPIPIVLSKAFRRRLLPWRVGHPQ